ncbi:DPB2 [Candida pseudojiufengensis]|uniref:DPB2 n=1 Tax=Candida pseudojiufengensis TaxID=497109 RepID=UPI0022251FAB|nr:DPB2 [Candida pseudojiufengensis]KAI5961857.1 DPB2 [Candida pseudojiufengensis]
MIDSQRINTSLPIQLQPSNLRPIVFRILTKKHGLNVNSEALSILTETISLKFGFNWKSIQSNNFLEEIAKYWKLEDRGIFIDGNGLKDILKDLNQKDDTSKLQKAKRSNTIIDEDEFDTSFRWEDYFHVISPNQQPISIFDKNRKQFNVYLKRNKTPMLQSISSNLKYMVESKNNHYYLIMDRLSRNENFQKMSMSSISNLSSIVDENNAKHNEITMIKNVLGRDGQKFLLFGLLTKNSTEDYILEDATDYIELNLNQARKNQGSFYCCGMYVLIEGIYSASGGTLNAKPDYIGGCFYVSNIAQPPAERRDKSIDAYGHLDFLGVHKNNVQSTVNDKAIKIPKEFRKKMNQMEKSLLGHKLIVLGSELHLDSNRVLEGLVKFFKHLENSIIETKDQEDNSIPLALVLIGSFSSIPLTSTNSSSLAMSNSEIYKSNFDQLSHILNDFPNIVSNCKIVLIPGNNDPWQSSYSSGSSYSNIYPQSSIPKVFINRLEKLLPRGNLILAWNPTRINYLSQEILIFKDQLMNKFKRNDILFPVDLELEEQQYLDSLSNEERINKLIQSKDVRLDNKTKQARKLVKTLLDQGNLQPFNKNLKIINQSMDYSLRIEPSPNLIILNDSNFENFEIIYQGCRVINLTSVVNLNSRKLNYMEYYPATKKVEFNDLYF